MKKIFTSSFLFILIFSLGFSTARLHRMHRHKRYWKKYRAKSLEVETVYPVKENKSIVIIVPSYNNKNWYDKNLRSIAEQQYDNFHLIYIDDASTDGTADLVQAFIEKNHLQDKCTLIRNKERKGALANLYYAIHSCSNEVIITTLDGDDWLSHPYVLSRLNQAYANPDVWMTYGQYITYPQYQKGHCASFDARDLKEFGFRSYPDFRSSHLRTFYAGLFKKISKEDLFYKGNFLEMGLDLAFMIPMLEMAKTHYQFIPDILYVYNRENPINDDKKDLLYQVECASHVKSLPCYEPLPSLF